jgi:hypothetical protein
MKNTTKTAAADYSQRAAIAQDRLRRIASRLSDHQTRQAAEPGDWGYAGTLAASTKNSPRYSPPSETAAELTNWGSDTDYAD